MSEEKEAPQKPKMKTGFAVLVNEDGNMFVERNPQVFSLDLDREATLVEVRRFCSEIVSDLQAQAAAEYTVLRIKQLEKSAEAE
jgi:hypothetical protein